MNIRIRFATLLPGFILIISAFEVKSDVTYTYTGNPYTYFGNTVPGTDAYSSSNYVTFSFTTAAPLSPGAVISSPSVVLAWTFSDGIQTFTSADGITLDEFQMTPSSTPGVMFDNWFIDSPGPPCTGCVNIIQTRNQPGLVGDWSQNPLFNYGGNWNAPGQWFVLQDVAPQISPRVTGTIGQNGWYIGAATVSWTVTGAPTPITTGCGKVSVPQTGGSAYTCVATSAAGTASYSVTIKRDTIPPKITIARPANGATYQLSANVTAEYTCTDSNSGVGSCIGGTASGTPINTSSSGSNTFTVVASDNAGNVTTKSVTYTVN